MQKQTWHLKYNWENTFKNKMSRTPAGLNIFVCMPLGPNELLGPRDIMLCSFVLLKQKKVLRCLLFRKSLKYVCEGSTFFFLGGGLATVESSY